MTQTVIWTVAILAVLGLLLALILFWVARKFKVDEDPRIDEVEKVMPGANCGGCGFAGCRAFADAAVKAASLDNQYCPVGGDEVMQKVASILGLTVAAKAPQVAVVRCNGSCATRPVVNDWDGAASCRVQAALYSGRDAVEPAFWEAFDYLKLGPYIPECGPLNNPSTNQRLYKITDGKPEDITARFWRKRLNEPLSTPRYV